MADRAGARPNEAGTMLAFLKKSQLGEAGPAKPVLGEQTPAAARKEGADPAPEAAGRGQGGQASPDGVEAGATAINAATAEPSPEPDAAAAAAAQQQQQQPGAAAKAGVKASGKVLGQKKRKREPLTEEQVAKLEAAFQAGIYPSTADKAALAEQAGLDADQVNKWFDKRRKKQREETGEPARRGRPRSGASKAAAAGAAGGGGGGAEVEAGPAGPAAQQQQQVQQQEQQQARDAMEVDDSAGPAAEEAPAPTPGAALRAPGTEAGTRAEGRATGGGTGDGATPAAPAGEAQPAAGAGSSADAKPPAGKTPASAPAVPRDVGLEEKASLLAELAAEVAALRNGGLAPPLAPLPAAGSTPALRLALSDARLCAAVAGQRAPLSRLVAALAPAFKAPEGEAPVEEAVLRSRVIDLASRKSFAPTKDGTMVDALEDEAEDRLWQWELRDAKHLPKEQRAAAAEVKRRAARVQERLKAVLNAAKLLEGHAGGRASPKLAKALEVLARVQTLEQVRAELAAEAEAAAAKKQASTVKKQASAGKSAEERERAKAEKAAQREAEKAEKEAEREAKRAERDRKHKEAEASANDKKVHKKTGFKDSKELQSTSRHFLAFFKPKGATAGETASSPGTSPRQQQQPAATGPSSREATSQLTAQRGGAGGGGQQGATSRAAGARRERSYADLFLKPQGATYSTLDSLADGMDAAFSRQHAPEALQDDWRALVARTKAARRAAAAAGPPVRGLPPSWARRGDALQVAAARLQAICQESGQAPAEVKIWRRKLLSFPSDTQRPPYYGSHSVRSSEVRARRFWGRDGVLDYDVMSDQEWEDEGDGESLSKADGESEAAPESEAEQDSFVCSDGHLSEDEGIQLDDDMETDSLGAVALAPLAEGADAGASRQRSLAELAKQMERAKRAGKPLIISRLPSADAAPAAAAAGAGSGGASPDEPSGAAFLSGDASLLRALTGDVLVAGVAVRGPPEDLAAAAAAPAAAPGDATPGATAGAAPGGGAGAAVAADGAEGAGSARPSGRVLGKRERPEELVPHLLRMIVANPKQKKDKLVDEFLSAHASGRNVPKKWVQDRIKEAAEYVHPSGWRLLPAARAALDAAGGDAAGGAAATAAGPEGEGAGGALAPTPVTAPAAARAAGVGGPLDLMLGARGGDGTPGVPSALRPGGPATMERAPQRLVTTTAPAELPPPLEVPPGVVEGGTADAYWNALAQHIHQADSAAPAGGDEDGEPEGAAPDLGFAAAFEPAALARHLPAVPAFIVTALVAGAAGGAVPAARRACVHALRAVAEALAGAGPEEGGDLSASQRPWVTSRTAPLPASLERLCGEEQLVPAMLAALAPAHMDEPGARGVALAALALTSALLRSGAGRAALAAGASGGETASARLAPVADAARQLAEEFPHDSELGDAADEAEAAVAAAAEAD
eukprot:scaffold22.g6092.t1